VAHIRDFEPILPDPQPYVEKALALYDRARREKRGRIVFIAAELGGGKTDVLNALAQALHHVKPEPNFVAGSFRGGEYHAQTLDWQERICLKKAVLAVGETAALLGLFPVLYSFAASFIGQLLQTSASAHEFANELKNQPRPGKETADWLHKLLRRTAEEKPLVCLLDDWDEAQRFYWDDMLLSFSREIAQDLPLLLFLTVKGPTDLATTPEKDESGLTAVIKTLTQKGLAEWWPLRKLSPDEVVNTIGQAASGIAPKLHAVTGGNARWVQEVWREWRLNEIVVMNEADCWVWGAQHKPTINLYDDIIRERLARLLNAETASGIEDAREVLACGALEGIRFTADAVAMALGWDRDDLIDFLDERLVQSEDNPDGLLLEDDNVNVLRPDGATRTLWRYSFVSDLHWLALDRYGFANEQRPDKSDSERWEKTAALVNTLEETYAPEERLVAAPLARLLQRIGHTEAAQHYQRMADYSADRELMRQRALYLLTINKDDWDPSQWGLAARFLIEAGKAMLNACPHQETRAVLEEAGTLAHRADCKSDEAYARYLCGYISRCEGDHKSARDDANTSFDIFSRLREKAGISDSLHLMAQIDYVEGRFDDARKKATQSLEVSQEMGLRNRTAVSLDLLAEIDFSEGRYDDARRKTAQSLKIYEEICNRLDAAGSLGMMAEIDRVEGRYDDARRLATQALKTYQEIGNKHGSAVSLNLLSAIHRLEGRYHEARRLAAQSFGLLEEIGERRGTAVSLHNLSVIARDLQQPRTAFDLGTLGILILNEIGPVEAQILQTDLADLLAAENYDGEQLVEMNRQVLDAYQKDGGKDLIENALARLRETDR